MRFLLIISILWSTSAFASECQTQGQSENLILDQNIPSTEIINFPNEKRILPDRSDFEILHVITMSNEQGERWATLTIKNNSSGRRTISKEHILALFADGSRKFPLDIDYSFDGKEVASITATFGCSKFPILKLSTRT